MRRERAVVVVAGQQKREEQRGGVRAQSSSGQRFTSRICERVISRENGPPPGASVLSFLFCSLGMPAPGRTMFTYRLKLS